MSAITGARQESEQVSLRQLGLSRKRLNGAKGLVVAVISLATIDYLKGTDGERQDALAYFRGPIYRRHLAWLDLPEHWLPELVQKTLDGTAPPVSPARD